jgi:hypothetical protein
MSLLDFINTQQNPDPQRLAFVKLTPEFILNLLKVGDGVVINNEKITAAKDPIPGDAKAVRVGVDARDSTIILTFSSDSLPQQVLEGEEIPQLTPWFHRERINEDRKDTLLRAAYDILKRCSEGPYVVSPSEVCARWDNANCSGDCLMEEIACLLELEVYEPPIPLENDDDYYIDLSKYSGEQK